MKILYIPAENVEAQVARSYFFAKAFSKHHEVYKVHWYDSRNRFWKGLEPSSFFTFICFIKSLFRSTKIFKSNDFGYQVNTSLFLNAFAGRIIGNYRALNWMRKYNKKQLAKIAKILQPDIIFHADAFYFCPAINIGIPEFSDLQDDLNWKNIPQNCLKKEYKYYQKQFDLSKINFIVSENAAKSMNRFINITFQPIENGADFKTLRHYNAEDIIKIKKQYNIPLDKKIVSYIGGRHKFDEQFAFKLFKEAKEKLKDVVFILIGNLPLINLENVVNIGFLTVEEANKMYALSDIGITLKNSIGNDFLYNSVPLKFIQYGAVRKPIVTFPIHWSEVKNFENIFHIYSENTEEWITTIEHVLNKFKWTEQLENKWNKYDWQNIGDAIIKKIDLTLKNNY